MTAMNTADFFQSWLQAHPANPDLKPMGTAGLQLLDRQCDTLKRGNSSLPDPSG